jgi:hypothetical protein
MYHFLSETEIEGCMCRAASVHHFYLAAVGLSINPFDFSFTSAAPAVRKRACKPRLAVNDPVPAVEWWWFIRLLTAAAAATAYCRMHSGLKKSVLYRLLNRKK